MDSEQETAARADLDVLMEQMRGYPPTRIAEAMWEWMEAQGFREKAHTPTDDEREALNTLYWTHPDGHTTGLTSDAIDAILAANFRCSCPCHTTPGYFHIGACCSTGSWASSTNVTPEQGEPSDARVSVAAKAIAAYQGTRYDGSLRQDWDNMARAALRAAGGVR